MNHALAPCESCRRHFRTGEPRCPFCDAPSTRAAREPRRVNPRLGSLAKITFHVALAGATATACGGQVGPDEPPEPEPSGGAGGTASSSGGRSTASAGAGGVALNDDIFLTAGNASDLPSRRPPPLEEPDAGAPTPIYRATPSE